MAGPIRTIHLVGDSPERVVAQTDWSGMAARHLSFLGLTDGGRGYEMQRPCPDTGHVLISYAGGGEVWADGKWRPCVAGQAYITPRHAAMGFRTVGGRRWKFAWIYLPSTTDTPEPIAFSDPTISDLDPRPMVSAMEGLYMEVNGAARTPRLNLWGDLVVHYLRELITGDEEPDPLWRLWSEVDARLSEPWTLERLAAQASLQPEALRRLMRHTVGRSPMKQVTHLRMRRAEALLRSTNDKLFSIARQVGYQNVFAFSTAFRRWHGRSPKEARKVGR